MFFGEISRSERVKAFLTVLLNIYIHIYLHIYHVYQATVTTGDKKETYIGLTATQFKARYRNHLMSFRHERRRNETELSKHLWQLKEANKEFNITWKILAKAKSYTNLTKRCNLYTTEKFFLICRPHMATLTSTQVHPKVQSNL